MKSMLHLLAPQTPGLRGIAVITVVCSTLCAGSATYGAEQVPAAPAPTAPAFQPPPAKPLATWCKLMGTDPLLRPPFAGAPLTDPKGLAAKIRAEQLDQKNRIKAAKYLGTVDCVAYPEAQAMLVEMLQNDKYEPVRYQAALSLGMMMCHGKSRADQRRMARGRAVHYDTCRGCCNEKVLKALAKTAYDTDDYGCPFEPSKRVRDAALQAIHDCGCEEACPPYTQQAVPPQPVPAPPAVIEPTPPKPREEAPPRLEPKPQASNASAVPTLASTDNAQPADQPVTIEPALTNQTSAWFVAINPTVDVPPLAALNSYCIVSLKSKQFVKVDSRITSVYKHRTYEFSTIAAKLEFDRSPETYCVQLNGADPVELMNSGAAVEGRFLREHNGQNYLFVSRANWDAFKSAPESYLRPVTAASAIVPATPAAEPTTKANEAAAVPVTPSANTAPAAATPQANNSRKTTALMTLRSDTGARKARSARKAPSSSLNNTDVAEVR